MANLIFTSSWDDGDKLDLKLARLLAKYGVKGSFYVPQEIDFEYSPGRKVERLSDKEIIELDKIQEVGVHTLTHRPLSQLSTSEIDKEISGSKKWLEDLLNHPINIFAYPGGKLTDFIENKIKEAGFKFARGNQLGGLRVNNRFNAQTTINCYPLPFCRRDRNLWYVLRYFLQPLKEKWPIIRKFNLPINSCLSWYNLATNLFDKAKDRGGVYHLIGHSFEIDKYKMWSDLERFLQYITTNYDDIEFKFNSEL